MASKTPVSYRLGKGEIDLEEEETEAEAESQGNPNEVSFEDDVEEGPADPRDALEGQWLHGTTTISVQDRKVTRAGVQADHAIAWNAMAMSKESPVTWQFKTVWNLKYVCASEALWERATNKEQVVWKRPWSCPGATLGHWWASDGAHVEATHHQVWRDGQKYRPVTLDAVKNRVPPAREPDGKEGGCTCWKDGGGSTWTVDPTTSTARSLVWVKDDSRITWTRRLEELQDLAGVWKSSDGARITITNKVKVDTGVQTRGSRALGGPAEASITFAINAITFTEGTRKEDLFLDMIRSNPSVILYWHSYVTHTDVIWRREHLSGAQPAQGISIDECGTAGYNQHAGLVKTQSKAICARNFNHDKDGATYTYNGVKPDHVESLLYTSLKQYRSWLLTAASRTGTLEAFAIVHDVGQYDDGRRLYLDVVCARRQEKPKPGQHKVQYGKMIMDALEEHARTSGYSVIELASLNVWLTDKYYRDRGYVEKEHPCSDLDEERHPTYALANKETPESLPEKKLRTICEGRNIGTSSSSLEFLRSKLSDQSWLGYRMTKWLEGVAPGASAAPAATPARAPLKRMRSTSEEPVPRRTLPQRGALPPKKKVKTGR